MPISVKCPECDTPFKVPHEAAGKAIKCKRCGARISVPTDGEAVQAGPPDPSRPGSADREDNGSPDRDDDRPLKKKKQKSNTGMMLMVIGGVLLLSCCVCGGGGGFAIYWFAYRPVAAAVQEQIDVANDKVPLPKGNVVFDKQDTLMQQGAKMIDMNRPAHTYKVKLEAGKRYQIDHKRQGDGDPFLVLVDPQGKELARDDDGGGNLNSRILFTPAVTGEYTIHAAALSMFAVPPNGMRYRLTVVQLQ